MDWQALRLSMLLGLCTAVLLIPAGVPAARAIAWNRFFGRSVVQSCIALPLILPPTVLGFYLLVLFGNRSAIGRTYESLFHEPLAFSFQGILLASLIFNIPFVLQPMQRAFEGIPASLREAAWCSGLSHWQTFWRVELPLAWPGVVAAFVLTFAHTLGEFGVVLMVGGNIEAETRTISIAIYDQVQALDDRGAGLMSAVLLLLSFTAITTIYSINERFGRGRIW